MVRGLGVLDPQVAKALREVPRERFVPADLAREAYDDAPLAIGPSATISAPHMVALQLEAARLVPGMRVLEAGSGSGYVLALLARLLGPAGRVVGIEIEPELVDRSRRVLSSLGYGERVTVRQGDAADGSPGEAPFDRVLVSFAVEGPLPARWGEALRPGGRLIVPHGRGGVTYLMTYRREGSRLTLDEQGPACLFVASKSSSRPPS